MEPPTLKPAGSRKEWRKGNYGGGETTTKKWRAELLQLNGRKKENRIKRWMGGIRQVKVGFGFSFGLE